MSGRQITMCVCVCVSVGDAAILTVCGGGQRVRAVLQPRAERAGRETSLAARRAAARAPRRLRHTHFGPHRAPSRRAHGLIRYYKPTTEYKVFKRYYLTNSI